MKKTNAQLFSLVAIAINSPINVSPEDSETLENPKEAKNAEEPENPVNPSAPDTPNATSPDKNEKRDDGQQNTPLPDADGYVSLLAYSICRDSWLIKFRKEEENIKIVVSLIILSDLLLILIAYLCKITKLADWEDNGLIYFSLFISVICTVLLIGCLLYYKFYTLRNLFNDYHKLFHELITTDINVYIECRKESADKMCNFINKFSYDKLEERKVKNGC